MSLSVTKTSQENLLNNWGKKKIQFCTRVLISRDVLISAPSPLGMSETLILKIHLIKIKKLRNSKG